jgi:uroporphyrinogen-III synthase
MRVLVTRPLEDSQRTARALAACGHHALIAPLSEIHPIAAPEPRLDGVQAVLATSSNGIRAFARVCPRRDIRVFAVGAHTAAAARAAGFLRVTSADGDGTALAAAVRKSLAAGTGALLHATGKNSARNFYRELAEAGFDVRSCELYETVPSAHPPMEAVAALRQGSIDAILVLSPENGRMLAETIQTAGGQARCAHMIACCISAAAAATLADIGFGAIRIAEKPDLQGVLALLDIEPSHPPGR